MSLFSTFRRETDYQDTSVAHPNLSVDLSQFLIGSSPLGKPPWEGDFFCETLQKSDQLAVAPYGYEITAENGVITSVFLPLDHFCGTLLVKDEAVSLTRTTTRAEALALFGDPYWTDQDDGEVILFYEYPTGNEDQNDTVELQLEFPDGEHLAFITLTQNGVLSKAEQRQSYGVTKPWPP